MYYYPHLTGKEMKAKRCPVTSVLSLTEPTLVITGYPRPVQEPHEPMAGPGAKPSSVLFPHHLSISVWSM